LKGIFDIFIQYNGWQVLANLAFTLLPGWAAYETSAEVFIRYQPISWVVAVILGGLAFAFCVFLWGLASFWFVKKNLINSYQESKRDINPLDNTFNKQKIDINSFRIQFYSADPIKDKTFVDCEIHGPGVLYLQGSNNLDTANFVDCNFAEIRDGEVSLSHTIVMKNVTARKCRFLNFTFLVHKKDAAAYKGAIPGLNWIT